MDEFPKVMSHPHAQPAVNGYNYGQGKPAKFPPVTVNNEDQQEYYEAKGYRVRATGDDLSKFQPTGYKFVPYPKWVNGVLVQNAQEEAALNVAKNSSNVETKPEKDDLRAYRREYMRKYRARKKAKQ